MIIENSKTYNVTDVENLFFRPSFCGKSAEDLGIRVLYNMPTPTKVPIFFHHNDILREFSSGWQGGTSATVEQKEIEMSKLKAESAYSAEVYFSTIYEMLTNSAEVNLGDLSGTDLEKAETELFRRAIVDSIDATTWVGDTSGDLSDYTGFTGFIRKVIDIFEVEGLCDSVEIYEMTQKTAINEILYSVWDRASDELRALSSSGNLVYYVSSDLYDAYQFFLDDKCVVNHGVNLLDGRQGLTYHGIPIVEIPSGKYNTSRAASFCILTDRRNFVLALNTADSPEKEIRMWYNPDEMENRQRVVFLAGATIVDSSLVSATIYDNGVNTNVDN